MKFDVVETESMKHYECSSYGQRQKVLLAGFTTFAACASPIASEPVKHEWAVQDPQHYRSMDDVFYKAAPAPLHDHPASQIGSGTERSLDTESVMLSLAEHKGDMVTEKAKTTFRNILDKFNGIPYLDCLATYSKVNRFVSTTVVLPYELCLNFTFLVDREADMLPYSIYHMNEPMLVGSCPSDDLAASVRNFLKSMAKNYGSVSC